MVLSHLLTISTYALLVAIKDVVAVGNHNNVIVTQMEDVSSKEAYVVQRNVGTPVLHTFCYSGESTKSISKLFASAAFKLNIDDEHYQMYKGKNESDVYQQFETSRQSWFAIVSWHTNSVNLNIFNKSCVGIVSQEEYKVKLDIKTFDLWIVSYLIIGLLLFFTAPRLSKNVVFFYGAGVSVGLVASLLIVVYVISKFTPKKHYGAYAVLIGGWSIALYLFQTIWENIELYLEHYKQYVIGYFVVAGVLSFSLCYYKGPPTEPRSLNLIKWAIQLIALILVYNGTQIAAVSISIIAFVLLIYNFPTAIVRAARSFWRRRFPPKVRLLTEEEYETQGREETMKALQELRDYCKSPECDAWKTVCALHSPRKFASFIEGDSHITDDEFKEYESADFSDGQIPVQYETDDESDVISSLSFSNS